MKKIAVYGASGLGREVLQLINHINQVQLEWEPIGFFDDGRNKGEIIHELPVLGGEAEINSWSDEIAVIMAIGSTQIKKRIFAGIKNSRVYFPSLIHPYVKLMQSNSVHIGEGTVITSGCIITVDVIIGKHVLLNWNTTVGHDSQIGDYSSIMPAVNISGEVNIGEGVFIGTGAQVVNQKSIGSNSIIGAGAVVTKDIPSNCTAVGVPAVPIKFHD